MLAVEVVLLPVVLVAQLLALLLVVLRRVRLLLLGVAVLRAVLVVEVALLQLLLRRPSFSAAMARTIRCQAQAPTYEPGPRSR